MSSSRYGYRHLDVGNLPTSGKIEFNSITLNEESCSKLAQFLLDHPAVNVLIIKYSDVGSASLVKLVPGLIHLKELCLYSCKLYHDSDLRGSLSMYRNLDGINALSKGLIQMTKLKKLELSGENVVEYYLPDEFYQAIHSLKIEHLRVERDVDLQKLLPALNHHLVSLDISIRLGMKDLDVDLLVEILRRSQIRHLNLEYNGLTDAQILKLVPVIGSLKSLKLNGNAHGSETIHAMAETLFSNTSLYQLNIEPKLGCPRVSPDSMKRLLESMQSNRSIVKMNYPEGGVDLEVVKMLRFYIGRNLMNVDMNLSHEIVYDLRMELLWTQFLKLYNKRPERRIDASDFLFNHLNSKCRSDLTQEWDEYLLTNPEVALTQEEILEIVSERVQVQHEEFSDWYSIQ